jgi:hypothetical protein
MRTGDLVRCRLSWEPDSQRERYGIILDAIDAPEDVKVYLFCSKKEYWLRGGEFEVVGESR